MNALRLRHLITVLERVPLEHFDLMDWKCGTTACAVGWAGQDPVFNAEGFALKLSGDRSYAEPIFVLPDSQSEDDNPTGFNAAQIFFGLTSDQADDLFMPGAYQLADIDDPKPQDVINRIRELLGEQPSQELDDLIAQEQHAQQALDDLENGS